MVRAALSLLIVAMIVPALMPGAQAAAHNAAWSSDGLAVGPDGSVFLITVAYHGFCTNLLTVDVKTLTGELVQHRDFRGFQTLLDMASFNNVENFQVTVNSLDPTVAFDGHGYQRWVIGGSQMWQVLTGHFQGLTFAIDSLAEPWVFCN